MNEEEIIAAALKLPKDAQLRLAAALQQNVEASEDEFKEAVYKLAMARRKAYLEGKSTMVSPEEAIQDLRESINARV
ncbi:MAG: hypothetical protein P1V97_14675 [Planctomycetota bacterium]|nr:hypothetical protein [Planctomycetota bacterium]